MNERLDDQQRADKPSDVCRISEVESPVAGKMLWCETHGIYFGIKQSCPYVARSALDRAFDEWWLSASFDRLGPQAVARSAWDAALATRSAGTRTPEAWIARRLTLDGVPGSYSIKAVALDKATLTERGYDDSEIVPLYCTPHSASERTLDTERLDAMEGAKFSVMAYGEGWSYRIERGPNSPWRFKEGGMECCVPFSTAREAADAARAEMKATHNATDRNVTP